MPLKLAPSIPKPLGCPRPDPVRQVHMGGMEGGCEQFRRDHQLKPPPKKDPPGLNKRESKGHTTVVTHVTVPLKSPRNSVRVRFSGTWKELKAQKRTKKASKWGQYDSKVTPKRLGWRFNPKMVQNHPKMTLLWSYCGSKMVQSRPILPQLGLKMAQKGVKKRPKTVQ